MRPSPELTTSYYLYTQSDNYGNSYQSSHYYHPKERRYVGSRTANYRLRKKTHTLPMNNYFSDVIHLKTAGRTSYTTAEEPYGATVLTLPVQYMGDPPLSYDQSGLVVDTQNRATQKLYAAVQGASVNLAQFFAERKQVADLLADTATRIAKGALALKRGQFGNFANSLSLNAHGKERARSAWERVRRTPPEKRLANHWLEMVFGWGPLVSDMHDSASLLAESVEGRSQPEGRIKVQSTLQQEYAKDQERQQTTGGLFLHRYEDLQICKCRIVVDFELESSARAILSKTGISNPALLLWELLPHSHIVDWIIPVGTYLESLTVLDGFQIKSGAISHLQRVVSDRKQRASNGGNSQYNFVNASVGAVTALQARYNRVSTTVFPYQLKVRSPIGNSPLARFATASALLTQLFGRKG